MAGRIDRSLNTEEIAYYLTFLEEPLTEYDCGSLCRNEHNGVPYCCSAEHAVPLLYRAEFQLFQSMGNLWHEWKPVSREDKKLKATSGRDQVFCECTGVQHCVRSQRSVSCRTFPMEPYLDRRGAFVGLTFLKDFTEKDPDTGRIKCPLTKRPRDIRQEAIDAHFGFWEKIMLRRRDEYETYEETSRKLRRERDRTGRVLHILFPSHLKNVKSARDYI